MFAGGRLTDVQFASDQHPAHAVFDQITVNLRREMLRGVFEPTQDLQSAVVGECPECATSIHIDSEPSHSIIIHGCSIGRLTRLQGNYSAPEVGFGQGVSRRLSGRDGLDPWLVHFFNPAVKFVITVTDWLTCCGTRSRRIFLPSGDIS